MDLRGQRSGGARAIAAIAAIYALLVVAFLPRAVALPGPDGLGVVCAHDASGAPQKAAHDHRGCCTAAAQAALLPDPAGGWAPVRWPSDVLAFAPLRPEADRPRTGPPVRATSPRGPPLA